MRSNLEVALDYFGTFKRKAKYSINLSVVLEQTFPLLHSSLPLLTKLRVLVMERDTCVTV